MSFAIEGTQSVMNMAMMAQYDMQGRSGFNGMTDSGALMQLAETQKMAQQSSTRGGQLNGFLTKPAVDNAGVFDPFKRDILNGEEEVADRHKAADGERAASRREYANGEHGVFVEVLNQGGLNFKENTQNIATGVTTGAKLLWDGAVEVPGRMLGKMRDAVVHGAGDAIKPSVDVLSEGAKNQAGIHNNIERERELSRKEYASAEHGILGEVLNQGFLGEKEKNQRFNNGLATGLQLAGSTFAASFTFITSTFEHLISGK